MYLDFVITNTTIKFITHVNTLIQSIFKLTIQITIHKSSTLINIFTIHLPLKITLSIRKFLFNLMIRQARSPKGKGGYGEEPIPITTFKDFNHLPRPLPLSVFLAMLITLPFFTNQPKILHNLPLVVKHAGHDKSSFDHREAGSAPTLLHGQAHPSFLFLPFSKPP
jgi:hypothetical protein